MSATLTAGLLAQSVLATAAEGEEAWTPGVLGFLVTLALVLACIPIFRSMTGKIRGVQHRGTEGAEGEGVPGERVPCEGVPGEPGPGESVPDERERDEREPGA